MLAVGHLALGYLLAKTGSKLTKTSIVLPLVFFLAILPDIDLLFPLLRHRGITHSIILQTALFIPLFWFYRKQAFPYFIALIQHSLIGDFFTGGGIELFWPLRTNLYGLHVPITSLIDITSEWVCFLLAIAVILKTKDLLEFFKIKKWNYFLFFPLGAIFFSTLVPLSVNFESPAILLVPELTFFALFSASILWTFVIQFRRLLS